MVCPHAGYEFSAKVAASGYKQLTGRDFSTVILLGPSHLTAFEGAFVSTADAYQTPLGMVPLSPEAAKLAKLPPLVTRRRGEDSPEKREYSLEVQLPFLQRTLHDFSIVPIIFGDVDARKVADRLIPLLDARVLIVASSDLSHFHPYEEAVAQDTATVKAICGLDPSRVTAEDACGYQPVLTLIDIARRKGWKAQKLDYRNSGDTTGDKSRVVGYAAIAFYDPNAAATGNGAQFTPTERRFLLELARKSVAAAAAGTEPPKPEPDAVGKFLERRACFVTLTKGGELRGCIGSMFPQEPLTEAVIHRARSAAVEDPRFPPVRPDELKDIQIEVSVLNTPKPLRFTSPDDLLAKLRPGIDGVVLRVEGREATYLPQVWEQLPGRRQFMSELAQKAGLPADAWTQSDASVLTYQVEAFKEKGGGGKGEGGRRGRE